ncbi:MAG: M28 family metallopeptidase [Flavobacteriales bacterium]|nr:M28 family metallopeptidase [Flavobacteriales bacterium]MCX7650275.1 M28 family metallopeptidase [Flavobacteriales bacterium]MDW8431909.1 M28 family peptidase [Flavobacteriales bacterium]
MDESLVSPKDIVRHILARFGPRRAGSAAEQEAQQWLADYLSTLEGVRVRQLPFQAPLRSKFQSSRLIWPLFGAAYVLVFVFQNGLWGFLLSSLAAVFFFLHFVSYRHILDFLFSRSSSLNVEAVWEPPDGTPRRTVVLSGHIDSTPEFIWWYRLGHVSAQWMVLSGALLMLFPAVALLGWIWNPIQDSVLWKTAVPSVWSLALLGSLQFIFIHGRRVVDGAQDNLSGIACALHTFRQCVHNKSLRNTRLVFVSFGAEETGLRGSDHYVRHHVAKAYPDSEVLNINLDGILLTNHLNFITAEPSIWIRHNAALIQRLRASFEACGLPTGKGPLWIGATDGASFARHGYRSATLVGLPLGRLHPTYHTRRDTLDQLDGPGLVKVCKALEKALSEIDSQDV